MKARKVLALLLAVCLVIVMAPAMAFADDVDVTAAPANDDIIILATSDVHCGVDDNIGYAGLAAYKKAMEAENPYVTLVDAGDAIQGAALGTLSQGEYLVDIMNKVGYDICVPGNHEFDYTMDQFFKLVEKANAKYISCNFVTIADSKPLLDAYEIRTYGDKKVAYIGVSTPETLAKSSPAYFQDEAGNWIYDFCNDSTGAALYKQVQNTIDAVKAEGVDYIIAVGHLGDDPDTAYWKSTDVIANTTGLDAWIDGHAHQTFAKDATDKSGKAVKVLATGTKLENIGKLVIAADGTITVENVAGYAEKDADVDAFVKDIQTKSNELLKKVVAKTNVNLTTKNEDGTRAVRSKETNLGDLCADAYKYVSGADIAFVNGGGIRADLPVGDLTYEQIIAVHPYGNKLCVCEATGQEILDALELGSRSVGTGESGGFLQVSGLTYEINPYIDSTVVLDDQGMFVSVSGARKVSNVLVNGEPIDPAKTYTLACHNYKLKQCGDGYTMFKDNVFLQDEVMLDNEVLINYITKNLNGTVGEEYAAPQGRIKVLDAEEALKEMKAASAAADAENAELKAEVETLNTQITALQAQLDVAKYTCTAKVAINKKANVKLTWNKSSKSGVKYQVYRATSKTGKYTKMTTTSNGYYKTTKLKSGKTYYYKVRAIKTVDGKTYYGKWSAVKTVKAK